MDTLGEDAAAFASFAGLDLDPWQENVLVGALGTSESGRLSAFEVGLVVPRQNGKGSVLEALELYQLYVGGISSIIHTAHRFSTAQDHMRRLTQLIMTSRLVEEVKGWRPGFEGIPPGIKTGNQDMSITLKNGNRLKFLARKGGNTGRGFSADLVVLDEAYDLSDAEIAAMMPLMASRSMGGSPQIWYTSSAGMPDSDVLARLRDRAVDPDPDDSRFFYAEWSVPDDADPDSPESWAISNPSLGIRLAPDFVENERRTMSDEEFKRERLGIWAKLGGSSAISSELWGAALDAESSPGEVFAIGIDVTPLRDAATIALASHRPDGKVHVELMKHHAGTDWVVAELDRLITKYRPHQVVYDAASQAASVIQDAPRLRRKMEGLVARDYMQACGEFYEAIVDGEIRHLGDQGLDEAVEASRMSQSSNGLWRWTKEDKSADITPLVAVTLARRGLMNKQRKQTGGWMVFR